ncbi:YgiW/YdeI family stress tolerance OB fold protein [Serpentinimonas barnesii]|uniref:YgiW/YdeI family stress tolerance OB fold protein n=1 Tax=Serpentinimonas barnesii TaxID=1458427 RepID=UPI0005EDC9C5|nr:NirD/YgiW/YdeI family stress tolerance protein [Serpentinimonas barnesii]
MPLRHLLCAALLGAFMSHASAQFTGPSVAGPASTVQQAQQARLGSYLTLTGHIVAHQREDYYLFRDASGELRVEIEPEVWQGRRIGPEHLVRLHGEIDQGLRGRYLWVKTLQPVN